MKASRKRSILKTATWRVVATLTTTLIAYIFTGKLLVAIEIGSVEVIAKTVLYYLHERAWEQTDWGQSL